MKSPALEAVLARIRTHLASVDPTAGPRVLRQAVEDIFADPKANHGAPADADGVPAEWLPGVAVPGDRIVRDIPYWLSLPIIFCTVPVVTFMLLKFWALKR